MDDAANERMVAAAVERFGGIDILVNNASAIDNSGTLELRAKKYELMHQINGRGTFWTSKLCLPHLLKGTNPHVLNLSPPLDLDPRWFKIGGVAYTMAKYNMSMSAIGMAEEFKVRTAPRCPPPCTISYCPSPLSILVAFRARWRSTACGRALR